MPLKLYARAEVIRMLQIGDDLLVTLAQERIVVGRADGYTSEEVERIRVAHELAELGVNAAGLDVILEMREHWLAERQDLLEVIKALRAKPPNPG